jgi:pimeloyl-ACP methyl ester carboxylesterase
MGMDMPETRYARSGDVSIAYQVVGEGPFDVVVVFGSVSHVELQWEIARVAALLRGVAEQARVLVFDKRGTGLSDRVAGVPTLEERSDDIRAVMDAAGSGTRSARRWRGGRSDERGLRGIASRAGIGAGAV